MQAIRDIFQSYSTSGALSASSYRDGPLDLHAHIARGIAQLPKAYQPPVEWYRWTAGQSPLSTTSSVALAVVLYLSTVFGGRELMKGRKPYKLATLFQIHNLLLSGGSALLLVLMLLEIVPVVWKHGFFYAICNNKSWTPRLETYYIINYLFKYWELADTMFLVVKKKPLAFLHVYHHSATAVLCYTQLNGGTSISWTVITLNLFVHVIMYYYYWATAAGYKIWWKKYVTVMQITQFILDLGLVYFGTYSHFAYSRGWKPCVGDCAGSEFAALQGCAILSSYLVLFIMFYRKTYKKAGDKLAAGGKLRNGNGTASTGGRARSGSIAQAQDAADSITDATCGPAGVDLATEGGSGASTPIPVKAKANGKARK